MHLLQNTTYTEQCAISSFCAPKKWKKKYKNLRNFSSFFFVAFNQRLVVAITSSIGMGEIIAAYYYSKLIFQHYMYNNSEFAT